MNQFAIAIPELFTPNVLHQFEKKKKKKHSLASIYLKYQLSGCSD
jgi:hypothetical protein